MKASYFYLHLSVLLAGFTGLFGRLIELNEGLLVFYRTALAAMMMWIVLYSLKSKIRYSAKEVFRMSKSGILLTTHWLFFFASIKHSNVSIGVVCFGITSFFTAILEPIISRKKFIPEELLLSLLTILGIALIFHFDIQYRLGITLGVISSLFGSLYTIYNKGLVDEFDPKTLNFYQLAVGAVFLLALMPIYLKFNPTSYLFPNTLDWVYIILLAFFCTVILYLFFFLSLENLSAFTVSLTYNLEPIYTIALAFAIFHENKELSSHFYVGIALVILSVILQALFSVKRNQKEQVLR